MEMTGKEFRQSPDSRAAELGAVAAPADRARKNIFVDRAPDLLEDYALNCNLPYFIASSPMPGQEEVSRALTELGEY